MKKLTKLTKGGETDETDETATGDKLIKDEKQII